MKKLFKRIAGIIISIALIALCFLGGMLLGAYFTADGGITDIILKLLAIFVAYNLNVIIHEGGHLLFGLMTGYKFSSFRIWSFMLVKQNGKIKLRRFKLMGTGGQCLMTPPEHNKKSGLILFNLGGVLLNFVALTLSITMYLLLPRILFLSALLIFTALFSVITMLSNGIPLNVGGIANDGMNALHLSNDPVAAEAFHKQLLMSAAQTEGKRISEMPDEWFVMPEGADMQNVHVASLAVFAASRPLDGGDYATAERMISEVLSGGYNIIGIHKNLLTCDLILCRAINYDEPSISSLITTELKKLMRSMRSYPAVIRTEFIIALYVDKDKERAEKILKDFEKNTRKFPYRQEIENERAFMAKVYEKFKNKI